MKYNSVEWSKIQLNELKFNWMKYIKLNGVKWAVEVSRCLLLTSCHSKFPCSCFFETNNKKCTDVKIHKPVPNQEKSLFISHLSLVGINAWITSCDSNGIGRIPLLCHMIVLSAAGSILSFYSSHHCRALCTRLFLSLQRDMWQTLTVPLQCYESYDNGIIRAMETFLFNNANNWTIYIR